ncbi:hypothetical protein SAMN04515678_11490 [Roseivivax sediminis]|uniref:Uncharacterized protein n=1 Tax=Roseivivax sediminis TaxID=936889 RepID=A0A1I2CUF3_9RHOB|nr:hypothetical protein SAMN04515678_11490 [Roseivivax sediminis]
MLEARFEVDGVTSSSIPVSDAAAARPVLELRHETSSGVANIRCAGLRAKPVCAEWARERQARMVQAYL